MKNKTMILLLAATLSMSATAQKAPDLGKTPQMG